MKKDWLSYTWLSVSEAARLEGLSEKVMRNWLRSGVNCRYVWRLNPQGEKEIKLSSLSHNAVKLYMDEELPEVEHSQKREDPEVFLALYNASPSYAKKKCDQWTQVLLETRDMRGTANLRSFVDWWNANNEFKISLPRLYAVRQEYMENGNDRSFLLKERQVPQTSVKKEWLDDFKECYLRQQRPSANDCRIYALGKARQRCENVNEESFPSLASFYRAAAKIGDGIKSWHRGGPKSFYDSHSLHIERDWSAVQAGWCWIGDTRTWDVMVNYPGFETLKRPYITMFVDARTDMPMGWHIHVTPPSAANTLMALRDGIQRFGKPDMLYVDNGREYRNKDFSGNPRGGNNWGKEGSEWMQSATGILDIRMKFAIARNARAKNVENFFGVCKKIIDKSFLSYFGGNSIERPEQVKELFKNKDKAISFSEFKNVMNENFLDIMPNYPCKFKRFAQDTRKKAWDYLYAQRTPMQTLTQEALDMIPTLTEECAVGRNGVSISKLGVSWWAEWMPAMKGEKIIVRYNPQDLSKAWGYEKGGRIIDEMGAPHIVPALIEALPEEERVLARDLLSKAMAAERSERKLMKSSHKSKGISEHDILEARKFALGIKKIDEVTGEVIDNGTKIAAIAPPTTITKHDADKQKLKERSEYGDPELLNMLG